MSLFAVGVAQYLLRKAAKARVDRMCKEHVKRSNLNAPPWLKAEWKTGNKDSIADLYTNLNFDKDRLRGLPIE